MQDTASRFPKLYNLFAGSPRLNMWKSLLLEYENSSETDSAFSARLLEVQETIVGDIEAAGPLRWPRKRSLLLTSTDKDTHLNLRFELLVAWKLLTNGQSIEFEDVGHGSAPDLKVLESETLPSIFIEVTTRDQRNPQILPEIDHIFTGVFATGGGLTEELNRYIAKFLNTVKSKCSQSQLHDWGSNCLLIIDMTRYGIAWIRPVEFWEGTLRELVLPWEQIPFNGLVMSFTGLDHGDLKVSLLVNPTITSEETRNVENLGRILSSN